MDDVIRRAGLLNDARLAETARREFGNENRFPLAPAASSTAATEAACPMQ